MKMWLTEIATGVFAYYLEKGDGVRVLLGVCRADGQPLVGGVKVAHEEDINDRK